MNKNILLKIRNKTNEQKKYLLINNKEYNNKTYEENLKPDLHLHHKNKSNISNQNKNYKFDKPSYIKKYFKSFDFYIEKDNNHRNSYVQNIYKDNFLNEEELNLKKNKTLLNDNNSNLYNNHIEKKIITTNKSKPTKKLIKIVKCEKLNIDSNNDTKNNKRLFQKNKLNNNYAYFEYKSNKENLHDEDINLKTDPTCQKKSIKKIYYQKKDNQFNNTTIHYKRQNEKSDLEKNFSKKTFQFQSNEQGQIFKNHSTVFISQISKPLISNNNSSKSNHIKKKIKNDTNLYLRKKITKTEKMKKIKNKIKIKEEPGEQYQIKNKKYIDNNDILNLMNNEQNIRMNKTNIFDEIEINKDKDESIVSDEIIETIEISENKDIEENFYIENNKNINNSKLFNDDIRKNKNGILEYKPKMKIKKNSKFSNNYSEKHLLSKKFQTDINKNFCLKNENQENYNFNRDIKVIKRDLFDVNNKKENKDSKIKLINKILKENNEECINNQYKTNNNDIITNEKKEIKNILSNINLNKQNEEKINYKNNINKFNYKCNPEILNKIEINNNMKNKVNGLIKDKNILQNIKINKNNVINIKKKISKDNGMQNKIKDGNNNKNEKSLNKKVYIKNENNNINIKNNLKKKINNKIYNLNNNIKNKIKSNIENKKKIIIKKKKKSFSPINPIQIYSKYFIFNNNDNDEINNINECENEMIINGNKIDKIKEINNGKIPTNKNDTDNKETIIYNTDYNCLNLNMISELNKHLNYTDKNTKLKINKELIEDELTSIQKNSYESQGFSNTNGLNSNTFSLHNKSNINSINRINFDMPINIDLDKIATEESKEENKFSTYNLNNKIKEELIKVEIQQQNIQDSRNIRKDTKIEKLASFINKLNEEIEEDLKLKNDVNIHFNNELTGYGKSIVEIEMSNGYHDKENNISKNGINNNIKEKYIFGDIDNNIYKENSNLYIFDINTNETIDNQKENNNNKKIGLSDDVNSNNNLENGKNFNIENNNNKPDNDISNENNFNLLNLNLSSPKNDQDFPDTVELIQKNNFLSILNNDKIKEKDNGCKNIKDPQSEYEFNLNEGKFYKPLTKYEDKFNFDKINPF